MQTVKAIADALGVTSDVVRHYTECKLVTPVTNSENKYKYYDEFDFLQLANARILLRSLGLPLPEVLEYNNSSVVHQKEILSEKSRQVRAQIEKLQELELRLHEVQGYLEKTNRCVPTVEVVERDSIHDIYTFGSAVPSKEIKQIAKLWAEHFPFHAYLPQNTKKKSCKIRLFRPLLCQPRPRRNQQIRRTIPAGNCTSYQKPFRRVVF